MLKKICICTCFFVLAFSFAQQKDKTTTSKYIYSYSQYESTNDSIFNFENYKHLFETQKIEKSKTNSKLQYKMPVYKTDSISRTKVFAITEENKYRLKIYNPETTSN